MSVPHTGKLVGLVNGTECRFNGDIWTSADTTLAAALNAATDSSPKTHFDIRDLAQHVCRKLDMQLQITEWEPDAWSGADLDGID